MCLESQLSSYLFQSHNRAEKLLPKGGKGGWCRGWPVQGAAMVPLHPSPPVLFYIQKDVGLKTPVNRTKGFQPFPFHPEGWACWNGNLTPGTAVQSRRVNVGSKEMGNVLSVSTKGCINRREPSV